MTALSKLLGTHLLPKAGGVLVPTSEALRPATAVGLYFSASWCGPCRSFTPALVDSYNKHLHAKGLRCVFVSWDQDVQSFNDYYSKMPWFAVPFDDGSRNQQLSAHFGVNGIPSFAILDTEGKIVTTEGRVAFAEDPTGENFPWRPPLVRDLALGNPGRINETSSLLCLCDSASPQEKGHALEALTALATAHASSPESSNLSFFLGTGGPLTAKVRELCRLPAEGAPQLVLLDIPDNGGFYLGVAGAEAMTEPALAQLLSDYRQKKLKRHQLESPGG